MGYCCTLKCIFIHNDLNFRFTIYYYSLHVSFVVVGTSIHDNHHHVIISMVIYNPFRGNLCEEVIILVDFNLNWTEKKSKNRKKKKTKI